MKKIISALVVIMLFSSVIGLIESNASTSEVLTPSFKIAEQPRPGGGVSGDSVGYDTSGGSSSGDYKSQMGDLINWSKDVDDKTTVSGTVSNVMGTAISVVRIVGVTVAVTLLLVIAMKYMTAAPGDKADIKKSAVAYVVGAVVLFAVTGILEIISKFANIIN